MLWGFHFIEYVFMSLNTLLEKMVLKYAVTTVRPCLTHTVGLGAEKALSATTAFQGVLVA